MIRPAKPSDITGMLELLHLLFSLEADFQFSAERQEKGLELLLASPSARVMVAEEQGEIIGMATGQLVISTAEGEPSLLIEDVVVMPPGQRRGIAGALLLALEAWGAGMGARRMQLLADCSNAPALDFYRHKGWRTTQLICLRKYVTKEILP